MDFLGFANGDFDFFRKKSTLVKPEYDQKKEEVKTHFREFCYQLQKCYHSTTGGTLLLEKDFHGLNKNKDYIKAKSKIGSTDLFVLSIDMSQDSIMVNLVCPSDSDLNKIDRFKEVLMTRKDALARFFKENKEAYIVLYRIDSKKSSDNLWEEEFKFTNKELSTDNFNVLVNNIEKLDSGQGNPRGSAGCQIKVQFSKSEAIRQGKLLPSKVCTEVTKFLTLCEALA